jgi:protein-tyrosine phosphatase
MAGFFVDVHSHVVPSGDDGVRSREQGLELCGRAARRGTGILFATPHVWPSLPMTEEREAAVREAFAEMAPTAARAGLELRLGFELTPTPDLLDEDPSRYRLEGLEAVLMELPFHGSLTLSERLGEHIEAAGLIPVIGHPERSQDVLETPGLATGLRERGWLLQLNGSSLLGHHGSEIETVAWELVDRGLADLVGSDGHRNTRPPFLDEAYGAVRGRVGERADALFDGSALGLGPLAAGDRVDLAQRG